MKPTVCWMSLGGTMGFSGANKHGWSLTMGCNWNGPGVALELSIYLSIYIYINIHLLENWWWLAGLIGIFFGIYSWWIGGALMNDTVIPFSRISPSWNAYWNCWVRGPTFLRLSQVLNARFFRSIRFLEGPTTQHSKWHSTPGQLPGTYSHLLISSPLLKIIIKQY